MCPCTPAGGLTLRNNPLTALLHKCTDSTPAATRAITLVALLTLLPTLLPLSWINARIVEATALCVPAIQATDAAVWSTIPRFLLSPLLHTELASGLASCFALFQLCSRIEQQRGTVAMIQLYALIILLTQSALVLITTLILAQPWLAAIFRESCYLNLESSSPRDQLRIPVWGAHPTLLQGMSEYSWPALWSWSIPTQSCTTNNFAVVFALLVFECNKATKDLRRLSEEQRATAACRCSAHERMLILLLASPVLALACFCVPIPCRLV